MKRKCKRMKGRNRAHPFGGLSQVNPEAAGIDIWAEEIVVCVLGSGNSQLVKTDGNYTAEPACLPAAV